jgi:hypothetical protein
MSDPVRHHFHADGTPFDTTKCMVPDHFVTTLVVKVRSLRPVCEDSVKALIQTQFEVKSIELTTIETYARN